jgi:type IV pilus assembly protein PilC
LILIAIAVAAASVWGYISISPVNRKRWHRFLLRVPIMGRIMRKFAIVEMTRTLALLLKSGLSMMVTLDLTRRSIHNLAVAQVLQGVRDAVEEGGSIEGPLRANPRLVDPVVTDMLVTGEESGQLDKISGDVARAYEDEVNRDVDSLGEVLPVLVILVIGVMVLLLAISLYVPLANMVNALSESGM